MNFREIAPGPHLEKLIQSYWVADGSNLSAEQKHTILPDGCFDLVIDIYPKQDNAIVLTGIWDKPIEVTIGKGQITVGCRFYPAAIDVFFRCRVADFNNSSIAFAEAMLQTDSDIDLTKLWTIKEAEDLLSYLDCCFTMIKISATGEGDLLLRMRAKDPEQSIGDFARTTGLSSRQLHRHCQNRFGISPKTYCSIQRFICAKGLLAHDEDLDLADLALQCHYYDQAHFIREFKRFSGITPAAYRRKRRMSDSYNTAGCPDGKV
jgi:AraC-like DNA-binding protein